MRELDLSRLRLSPGHSEQKFAVCRAAEAKVGRREVTNAVRSVFRIDNPQVVLGDLVRNDGSYSASVSGATLSGRFEAGREPCAAVEQVAEGIEFADAPFGGGG